MAIVQIILNMRSAKTTQTGTCTGRATTPHLLLVHSSSDINLRCTHDNIHSHHRYDFFLSCDPLADTCASLRCISKSNDAHKSRRVPRRRADDACGSTSRHSTFAVTVTLCIRLRSLPHLSSAFRSSRRLANENRNG